MKHIIVALIVLTPFMGIGQLKDSFTIRYEYNDIKLYQRGDGSWVSLSEIVDTIPSALSVSHKPPSFIHAIDGYCIYKNGICAGTHLIFRRKRYIRLPPDIYFYGCVKLINQPK